jgi:hypothetical protein
MLNFLDMGIRDINPGNVLTYIDSLLEICVGLAFRVFLSCGLILVVLHLLLHPAVVMFENIILEEKLGQRIALLQRTTHNGFALQKLLTDIIYCFLMSGHFLVNVYQIFDYDVKFCEALNP